MATFDNPSYFTISGSTSPQVDQVIHKSNHSKRFRSWFKLKRPFRAKDTVDENRNPSSPESNPVAEQPPPEPPTTRNSTSSANNDFAKSDVVYYNFTSATSEPAGDEDDVFSDTSTIRENVGSTIGSTRTLNRRRHSLGSWFRSSLAVVRKTASSAASTASGLESAAAVERPSTSSEHQLLPRTVSTSTNCVSYRSSKDVRTCESSGLAASCNGNASSSTNNLGRKSRSKLPVAVKSHVELRARARFARQEKLFGEAKAVASTSRIPRPVKSPHTTASLDRRYTNSTEVLASASSNKSEDNPAASSAASSAGAFKMETDNQKRRGLEERGQENRQESDDLFQTEDARARSRARTQLHRSRTVEERSRSCCSRVNIASRAERRRASLDVSSHSSHSVARRKCQRCREKVELSPSDRYDVVIIFSRNCTVASPWITYLSNVIQSIFRSNDRPTTSVTTRDVESIINCNSFGDGTFERGGSSYANQSTVEQVDNERWKCRQVYRKTVSSALLQIVLVSRPLLHHIGANANDPLGKLLHPKRVIGLMLGVDEATDISELHTSALYTFKYWPRITMADQDLGSIDRFIKLSASILQRSQPSHKPKVVRFKLTPKKLRSGENKVTLLLLETREDIRHQAEILVGSDEVPDDPIHITKMTWINPYCASFLVPDKFLDRDIIVKVGLHVGGLSWGTRDLKCQNKLGELSVLLHKNYLVGNPIDVMCQAMKISPFDHKRLDEELARNLITQKVPGHLFRPGQADDAPGMARNEEFPTVLHFAARFGLVELMWALLECPGAMGALKIRNIDGHDVIGVAQLHGHTEIVSNIETVLEVTGNSDHADEENADEDVYVAPGFERNEYDTLPPPRPVTPTEGPEGPSNEDDYLPLVPVQGKDASNESVATRIDQPPLPGTSSKGAPQSCTDELIYMMNMFKDGQINIRQLEIFFEQWKSRRDVVDDSEEKKAILKHMKVILQKKKVEEKKNTVWVLNRMKSVLKLRTAKEDAASDASATGLVIPPIPILPPRNLTNRGRSPQSSWSSDRSSAASRLSHDSGTHSDSTEEKKQAGQANPSAHEYDTPPPTEGALKTANDYAIPPHPRLVTASSPSLPPRNQSGGSTGGTLRPVFPLPRPPLKQDYLEEIFVNPLELDRKVTVGHPKGLATMPDFDEMDGLTQWPIRPPLPPPNPHVVVDEMQHSQEQESSAESFYMIMGSSMNSPKIPGSPQNDYVNSAHLNYPPQDEDDYVTGEEINVPGPYSGINTLNERKRPSVANRQYSIGSQPLLARSMVSNLSVSAPDIPSVNPPVLPPRKLSSGVIKPQPKPRKSPALSAKRE